MPPLLNVIGALVLTYWCSRAALWFLRNRGTTAQRMILAHAASLVFLALVAGWFERSPSSFLTYLPAQIFWLIADKAREQPSLIRRRSGSRRRSDAATSASIGRMITWIVGIATAGYAAVGVGTFIDESYNYAEVYLVDPGRGFRKAIRSDVVYALGKPDLSRADDQGEWKPGEPGASTDWLYKDLLMRVRFDPATGFVTGLSCQEDHPLAKESCPANLGINVGDVEDDLYEVLGAPGSEHLLPDGRKVMRYPDIGHDFVLEQFVVKSVRVYPDNGNWFAKLGRMLVWMLP